MAELKIANKKRQYVDNKHMLKLVKEFKKQAKPKIISEELGGMLKLIVDNMAYHCKFINYTDEWKNEMKSDALFNCVRYLDTFDPKKSKLPFAYFTRVTINAFKMRIKKEKFQLHKDSVIRTEIYNEFLDEFKLIEQKSDNMGEDLEDWIWKEEDACEPLMEQMSLRSDNEDAPPVLEDDV